MNKRGVSRRHFLRNSALGIVGAGAVSPFIRAQEKETNTPDNIKAYRKLGRTGFKASDISSGGPSDLPVLNGLLDAGVNYIDTAESYSNGKSEIITGQALKNRNRKDFFVTSKLHIKEGETKESIQARFNKCLERLDMAYIDCMMMHNAANTALLKSPAFHEVMQKMKTEGKLRFVGVSNHGPRHGDTDAEPMDKVLLAATQDGRFDVMLLVYNFIQEDMGKRIINACNEKDIGVTLMKTNPVGRYMSMKSRLEASLKAGEEVSENMKSRVEEMKKESAGGEAFIKKYGLESEADMRTAATRFVLTNPGTTCVLARCSTFEDVDQWISLSGSTISHMEKAKLAAYIEGPGRFYCRHACGLCESHCAKEVPVNTIMRYNHYFDAQGLEKHAMQKYAALTVGAEACAQCGGTCQTACPYGVPVHAMLTMAHDHLSLV